MELKTITGCRVSQLPGTLFRKRNLTMYASCQTLILEPICEHISPGFACRDATAESKIKDVFANGFVCDELGHAPGSDRLCQRLNNAWLDFADKVDDCGAFQPADRERFGHFRGAAPVLLATVTVQVYLQWALLHSEAAVPQSLTHSARPRVGWQLFRIRPG